MADIEKVITALELCTNISQDGCMMLCPYKDEQDGTYSGFCEQVLKHDALELLKESDRSKHGHWIVLQNCSNSGVYCSVCMNKMFDRYPMKKKFSQYCGHCGAHNDLQIEVR